MADALTTLQAIGLQVNIITARIADREAAVHATRDANSRHRLRRLIAKDRATLAALNRKAGI